MKKALTVREYALHRKVSDLPGGAPRAVQVAIRDGRLSSSLTSDRKRIRDAELADAEWLATTQSDRVPLTGPTSSAASPDTPVTNGLAMARTRREAAQAAIREMELAERQGELVPVRDIEAHLTNVFAQCRSRLLSIPTRARQRDPSLSSAQLVLIESLVREALEDLATSPEAQNEQRAS